MERQPLKIPLNLNQDAGESGRAAREQSLENDILAAKSGDWTARNSLSRRFMPLLTALAQKRASDTVRVNVYIEAGEQGLFVAAKKYRRHMGGHKFRIFALDFIEAKMDQVDRKPGFISRLFGRA